jgi:hypothetical protein
MGNRLEEQTRRNRIPEPKIRVFIFKMWLMVSQRVDKSLVFLFLIEFFFGCEDDAPRPQAIPKLIIGTILHS